MAQAIVSSERLSAIEHLVRNAPAPVASRTVEKEFKAQPRPAKDEVAGILADLAAQGRIHSWSPLRGNKRYWKEDPDLHLKHLIESAARQVARKPNELASAARKVSFGLPADRAAKMVRRLVQEGVLRTYPALDSPRGQILAHRDAPSAYLAALDAPFEKMLAKLETANFVRIDVLNHLQQVFSAPGRPDTEELILRAIRENSSHPGVPVSVHRVRSSPLLRDVNKSDFDRAALALFAGRRILLSRHDDALGLPDQEREELISDGRALYYVGICER